MRKQLALFVPAAQIVCNPHAAGGQRHEKHGAEQRVDARPISPATRPTARSISKCTTACLSAIVAATIAAEEAISIAACIISIEPSNGIPMCRPSTASASTPMANSSAAPPSYIEPRYRSRRGGRRGIARAHAATTMSARIENERGGRPAAGVIRAIYAVTAAACRRLGEHRPAGSFDMHRYEAGLDAAVLVPPQPAQHGVDRFRMKRRQPIGRIRLEAEQSPCAAAPTRRAPDGPARDSMRAVTTQPLPRP